MARLNDLILMHRQDVASEKEYGKGKGKAKGKGRGYRCDLD